MMNLSEYFITTNIFIGLAPDQILFQLLQKCKYAHVFILHLIESFG
jgi:hypothetical protein